MKATKRLLATVLTIATVALPVATQAYAGAGTPPDTSAPEDGAGTPPETSAPEEGVSKVILDTDMNELGDDAVTLAMLANSDEVDLLGVTVVPGNTWVEEGTAFGLRNLEVLGREDIPVVMGAGEPLMGSRQDQLESEEALFGDVGYMGAYFRERPSSYLELAEEPYGGYPEIEPQSGTAVDFIVEQVTQNPNEVTLFVIGPATNIALAVRTHPEIVPLVKEVIYMGGAIDVPGNSSASAEFNWWFDPEAIKIAIRTPFAEQTVVPLDVAETVFYTIDEYERIVSGADTPWTQKFQDLQGPQFEEDPNATSFVWDALAAGIFLDPTIATEMEERFVDVDDTYGPNYGRSWGYSESGPIGTQAVNVLFDIDRERFWDLYVDLMTRA